jgi:hypothetical protein
MRKEDLPIYLTYNLCLFSLDSTFNIQVGDDDESGNGSANGSEDVLRTYSGLEV